MDPTHGSANPAIEPVKECAATSAEVDNQIEQAQFEKLRLEILDLKRWWIKGLPILALAATLLGLMLQQRSESLKRDEERYKQSLQSLGDAGAPGRVAALLTLTDFANGSTLKAKQVAPVLVNQLWIESTRPQSQLDESVLEVLIQSLATFDKSVLSQLLNQNKRATIYLSRATGSYLKHYPGLMPLLRPIGVTITLNGLPFETAQRHHFVPLALDALVDRQMMMNASLPDQVQGPANDKSPVHVAQDFEQMRQYTTLLWTNSLAITKWLQEHRSELHDLSFDGIRLIAPDLSGLDLKGANCPASVGNGESVRPLR